MSKRSRKYFTDLSDRGKRDRLRKAHSFSSLSSSDCENIEPEYSISPVPLNSESSFLSSPSYDRQSSVHYVLQNGVDNNPLNSSRNKCEHVGDDLLDCHNLNYIQSSDDSSVEDVSFEDCMTLTQNSKDTFNSIESELNLWAVKNKVPLSTFSQLLVILKKYGHCNLPSDARTILKTPKHTDTLIVEPGLYHHFGVSEQVSLILDKVNEKISEISLMVNIDGLPLFKSSNSQVWPILCCITSVPSVKNVVFPVGIYYGSQKPNDPCAFLEHFVNDIKVLGQKITIKGNTIPIFVDCFVCDRPAEAYILGVKNHSGYSSCTKCVQVGEWSGTHVIFPKIDCRARHHEDFVLRTDTAFNTRKTILVDLPGIHFIDSFALDVLHLVYLGVVRSMLLNWLFDKPPNKLPAQSILNINNHQSLIECCIPFEFNRKPRNLASIKRWKATEFRLFLLYTGPLVLKGLLDSEKYSHFLTLHAAISILVNPELCVEQVDYAESLLKHFVKCLGLLYGRKTLTSNAHNLTHFADSVRKHGSAENFSSFKFENHLQIYKTLVRKGANPLQQICRRMSETRNCTFPTNTCTMFPKLSKPHRSGPLIDICSDPQYKTVMFENFKLKCSKPDNCCGLVDGSVILVFNIAYSKLNEGFLIIGKQFLTKRPFYSVPCKSTHLGIFEVSNLSSIKSWDISCICKKYVLLTLHGKNVVFPLLHTNLQH